MELWYDLPVGETIKEGDRILQPDLLTVGSKCWVVISDSSFILGKVIHGNHFPVQRRHIPDAEPWAYIPVIDGLHMPPIGGSDSELQYLENDGSTVIPLYRHPPAKWVGLTAKDIDGFMAQVWGDSSIAPKSAPDFAKRIQCALREKNGDQA